MNAPLPHWRVTGATVRGAIHIRRSKPNQDAIAWDTPAHGAAPRIVALADGHGAALHFRSHRGARLAVRTAVTVLKRFARNAEGQDSSAIEQLAAAGLATDLTQTWRTHVSADLDRRPISEWEVDAVAENMSASSLARLASRPEVAYGSTLVAAVLAPAYVLYLQLGDGDILEVDAGGAAAHAPLPADPLLHGNETTSLCMPNAWNHMRISVRPVNAHGPVCVMLSTDGYANSFVDAAGLAQAACDLCALSSEPGMIEVSRSLPGWLRATSAQGSGDDISVGLAVRDAGA